MSTRDVNLKSYLPVFLQEFAEYEATLDAEDPEFALMWEAANQVLDNAFIATADEYGIGRYESLLGLTYSSSDTLESRRNKVLVRWGSCLPYTIAMLLSQLENICGEGNVSLSVDPDTYTVYIVTDLEIYGLVEEIEDLLLEMIPANMVISCSNEISAEVEGTAGAVGGVVYADVVCAVNDYDMTTDDVTGGGSGAAVSCTITLVTSDSE